MTDIQKLFAQNLMDIEAIKLRPNEPFTWASGWHSPIYTDNRKTLSFPSLRSLVKLELCHAIQEHFPEAEAVAGVATGAIAQGALVADQLGLPYSYVRPKPKDHGMGNQVEGEIKQGAKVVVVEDLISTGGSSLKAVAALRAYGVEVIGMVASFTYGFPVAEQAFAEAGVKLITLSNYDAVIEQAAETGYIKEYPRGRQSCPRRMAQEPRNLETVIFRHVHKQFFCLKKQLWDYLEVNQNSRAA